MDAFSEFAFQIGDLVCFKHEVAGAAVMKRTAYREPMPLTIIERHHQQCHGGTQRLYGIRLFDSNDGLSQLQLFTEIELVPYVPSTAKEE